MSMISHQIDELRVLEDWLRTTGQPRDALLVASAIDTIQALSAKVADQNLNRSEIPNGSDPISRQAAIDYCYELINAENPSDPSDEWNYSQERINQTEVILHHLEFMPSADRPTVDKEYLIDLIQEAVYDGEACVKLMDMVDRPTGEWNRLSHDTFHCTLCGRTFIVIQGEDAMNYCPNCGAKMKGENK